MIPLKDNIPSSRFPIVNVLIIGVSAVVFLVQLSSESEQRLVERYGMIPARVLDPGRPILVREEVMVDTAFGPEIVVRDRRAAPTPFAPWLTLLTCLFLHGGWLHFLGNMWFLYIFGDNVEDRFGHLAYLFFYLVSGVAASAIHLLTNGASTVPTIGASGAIAGVMGGYFLLFPWAKVYALVPLVFIFQIFVLPAPLFLGFWFVLQFFQGTLSITAAASGGVAWWAHVGGFLTGLFLTFFFAPRNSYRRRETSW